MSLAAAAIGVGNTATNPVAALRGNARNGVEADPVTSSFDSLIGSQAEAPGETPKAAASKADGDSGTKHEDDQPGEAEASGTAVDTTAVSPQLPAWLLALRLPAATTDASDTVGWGELANPSMGSSAGQQNSGKVGFVNSTLATSPAVPTADDLSPNPINDAAVIPDRSISVDNSTALTASQTTALAAVVGKTLDALAAQASTVATQATELALPLNPDKTLSINPSPPATPALPDPAAALRQMLDQPLALDAPDASLRLGERLRWLVQAGVQEARLQLHPRELGSVDIRIRIEGQTASVWFGADHAQARAALEAAMPTLRDRFAADGLALSQAQVGGRDQPPAGQGRPDPQTTPQQRASAHARNGVEATTAVAASAIRMTAREARGLIDRYI